MMRGPISIAHKKITSEIVKKLKVDVAKVKKEKAKASKQNSGALKHPPSGFFIFMEDFRKSYKGKFLENKLVAADCGADKLEESDKSTSEVHDAAE